MLLPAKVNVERSTQISAPANVIFNQVNNLKAWEAWDPWHAKEPEMGGSEYSGPDEGNGATHCWNSENEEIGKGCMVIIESKANEFIKTALQFDGMDSAFGGFTFNESEGVTTVVWNMEMDMGMNPIGRIMGLMMDGMVGPDFENGLVRLKEVAEAIEIQVPKEYPIEISVTSIAEQPIYSIKDSANTFEIGEKLAQIFGEIMAHMQATGGELAGKPFTIWHKYDPGNTSILEPGLPVKETVEGTGRVKEGFIPAGVAVMGVHLGAYKDASTSYDALKEYMSDYGYNQDGPPWEVYITDPTEVDTAEWITHIYFRIQED